jgi:hypothetical protein
MSALAHAFRALRPIERDAYLGARRSGATPREAYKTASGIYRMATRF